MNSIKTEVSYLKGLIEGAGTGNDEKSAAIWTQVVTVCERMTDGLETLAHVQEELSEYVEALDEDLDVLEAQFQHGHSVDDDDDSGLDAQTSVTAHQ